MLSMIAGVLLYTEKASKLLYKCAGEYRHFFYRTEVDSN